MPVLGGGGIKSVQRGTEQRTSNVESTFTITITAVDTSKAFLPGGNLLTSFNTSTGVSVDSNVRIKLTNSTTLTVTNWAVSDTDREIDWAIAEFN